MKKRCLAVLMLALCLLTGCASLLEREYSTAEPHSSKFWESEATDTLRAENYQDIVNDLQLYGRRLAYTLALPKGNANDWHNVTVEFFGQKFRTYGDVVQGIENLIPLCWNKKVKVEKYG